MTNMKTCVCCSQTKPIEEFGLNSRNKDKKSNYCAVCVRTKSSDVRKADPDYSEKHSLWRKSRRTVPRYRASRLITDAKTRCPDVTVTLDWVEERIAAGTCSVTGIPFDLGGHGAPARPFTPSLDRIDPKQGYTLDNTQVVCWIYNRAKGVHGHEAVMQMVEALAHVH